MEPDESSNEAPFGPLVGMQICLTGCSAAEERRVDTITKALGGTLESTLQEGISCLLISKVGSIKYKAAQKLHIPTVTFDWIYDCKEKRTRLPYEAYVAGPFLGLLIACTQVDETTRAEVQAAVEAGGGKFVKTFCGKESLTHLVAIRPGGTIKYTAAETWERHIVTIDWVRKCVRDKRWHNEQAYYVKGASTAAATIAASSSSVAKASASSSSSSSSASASASSSASSSASAVIAAALKKPSPPPPPPPSFLWDDLPSPSSVPHSHRSLLQHDVFFISGFGAEQRDYLVRMILAGGGMRHHVLTNSVTKVLCGKDVDKKLLMEIKRHPCNPPCVKIRWLLDALIPGALEKRREARAQAEREKAEQEKEEAERVLRQEREREEKENADRDRERNEEARRDLQAAQSNKENLSIPTAMQPPHPNSPHAVNTGDGVIALDDVGGADKAPGVPDSQSFEESFILRHSRTRANRALRESGGFVVHPPPPASAPASAPTSASAPEIAPAPADPSGLFDAVSANIAGLKRASRPVELEWRVREVTGASLELDQMHGGRGVTGSSSSNSSGSNGSSSIVGRSGSTATVAAGVAPGSGGAMQAPTGRSLLGRKGKKQKLVQPDESQVVTWCETQNLPH